MEQPRSEAVAGFAAWAATYDETVAKEVEQYSGMPYAEMLRRVVQAAELAPGDHVLDVGAGTGTLSLAVAQHLPEGRVVGIDPTGEMLARARERAQAAGLAGRVEFRQEAAESLPFADASFDAAVSSIAMHHTTVRRSLSEIARVLKPGGRLAIADMSAIARFRGCLGLLLPPITCLYYLLVKRSVPMMRAELAALRQVFLKQEWEAMLRELGFVSIEVQEFRNPASEWLPSMLVIRARKGSTGLQ